MCSPKNLVQCCRCGSLFKGVAELELCVSCRQDLDLRDEADVEDTRDN